YTAIAGELEALNVLLAQIHAPFSLEHQNAGEVFILRKTGAGIDDTSSWIGMATYDEAAGDIMYAAGFGGTAATKLTATGALNYAKYRIIESLDAPTKVEISRLAPLADAGIFLQAVLKDIAQDSAKVLCERLADELGALNSRLERMEAPLRF